MNTIQVSAEKFNFKFLPAYADFLLKEKLEEFVALIIRFSKEEDLPLLKPFFSKFSEQELITMSLESYRMILKSFIEKTTHLLIEENVRKWVSNNLLVIDKDEINAEDISIAAFVKRKTYYYFLDDYTQNPLLIKNIREDVDRYTSHEELVSYNAYIKIQQEKLNKKNADLLLHEKLLLEAQEISEFGSYLIDHINPENTIITPQLSKITGLADFKDAEAFLKNVHPSDLSFFLEERKKAFTEGGKFDFEYNYFKDGVEKRFRSVSLVGFTDGKIASMRGTLKDITTEYQLIKKLTESEALHKQAQMLTHIGNWSWNITTNKVDWSDEMFRIYGLEPQSEEMTFERFISLIHPDYRERRIQEVQESLITLDAKDYTLKVQNPDGTIKMLKGKGKLELDENNKPLRLVGTCQDITKEYFLSAELINLNDSLLEKNAELERINKELESFNYVASHDLQEPLRKIQTFTNRLLEQIEEIPQPALNSIDKVITSASRMQSLIKDLIGFHQVSAAEAYENVQLNTLLDEVKTAFIENIENKEAVIRVGNLPELKVIPFQFIQLFTNLIGNAIKYKKTDTVSEIDIHAEMIDAENIIHKGVPSGKYVRLSVRDNGIGFEPEQNEKIFDLFKRLHGKEKYSGTGIGLSICKKIVHNHDGYILADGEKGIGACFYIYLPQSRLISLHQNLTV